MDSRSSRIQLSPENGINSTSSLETVTYSEERSGTKSRGKYTSDQRADTLADNLNKPNETNNKTINIDIPSDDHDDARTPYSVEPDEETNLPSDFKTWRSNIRSDIEDVNKDRNNDCRTQEDNVSVFSYGSDEDMCVPIGNRPRTTLNAVLADINGETGHSKCMNSNFIKNHSQFSDDDGAVTVDANDNHANDCNDVTNDDDLKKTYSYESYEETNPPSDFQTRRADIRSYIIEDIKEDGSNYYPTPPEDNLSVLSYDSDEDRSVPIGNIPRTKLNVILAGINAERGHSKCMNSDFIKNDFDLSDDDGDDDDDADNDSVGNDAYDYDSDCLDIYGDSNEGVAIDDDDNDDTDDEEDCDDYAEGETADQIEETNAIIKEAIRNVVAKYFLGNATKVGLLELDTDVTDNICEGIIADGNNCHLDEDDVRGDNNDTDDTEVDGNKNCIKDNDDDDDTDDDTIICNSNDTFNDSHAKVTTDDDDTDNCYDDGDTDDDIIADADKSCLIDAYNIDYSYNGGVFGGDDADADADVIDDEVDDDDTNDDTKANAENKKNHMTKETNEGIEKQKQEDMAENETADINLVVSYDRADLEDVNKTKYDSHLSANNVPTLGSGEESFVSVPSSLCEDEDSDAGPNWTYLEDNKGYVCVGDFAVTVKTPPLQEDNNDDRAVCCCFPFSKKRNRKTGLLARIFSRLRVFNINERKDTADANDNHANDGNDGNIDDDLNTTYSYESYEETNPPSDLQTRRADLRSYIIEDINKDGSNYYPTPPEDNLSVLSYDSDEDRSVPIGNIPRTKLNVILAGINAERGHSKCMNSDFIKNDFDLSDDDGDDADDADNDNVGNDAYDYDSDGLDIYGDSNEGVAIDDDDNDDTDDEEDCDDYAEGETADQIEETNAIIKEAIRDVVAKYFLGNATKAGLLELDTDVTDNICEDIIADGNNCHLDEDDVRGDNNDTDDTEVDGNKNCIKDNDNDDDDDDTDDDDADTIICSDNDTYDDSHAKVTTDDDDSDNGDDDGDTDDDIIADADKSCLIDAYSIDYSDNGGGFGGDDADADADAIDDEVDDDDNDDYTKANAENKKNDMTKEKNEGIEKQKQEDKAENETADIILVVSYDRADLEDVNKTKYENHLSATNVPTLGSGEERFVSVSSSLCEDEDSDAEPTWTYLEDNKGYVCVGDFAVTVKTPPLQEDNNDDRTGCCCFPLSKKRNRKTGLFARIFSRLRVFNRKNK